MIRNIIFDIGGVLIDWNPRYYFDAYFHGDTQREAFFLKEICGREINRWMDEGMLPDEAGEKMTQRHPEWRREIRDLPQQFFPPAALFKSAEEFQSPFKIVPGSGCIDIFFRDRGHRKIDSLRRFFPVHIHISTCFIWKNF